VCGRDSSVGIATSYGLEYPGPDSCWGQILPIRPGRPWDPSILLENVPGLKRQGCGVDRPTPSITEVKGSVNLYFYSHLDMVCSRTVFLTRRAAARYRGLASIIPGRERPEETTICYKISLVQLIINLNVILYLLTCHTLYISVLILFMIML
jgi:hypothetical protein